MSAHPTTRRRLLVIGATGKQGRALIQALVSLRPSTAAATRSSHPAAPTTFAPDAVTTTTTATADKDSKAIVITTSEAAADSSRGATPISRPDNHSIRIEWDILAVTRNPSAPRAKSLLQLLPSPDVPGQPKHTITLVQGDLDNPSTIRKIFEQQQHHSTSPDSESGGGGIWGVFTVLMYPGVSKQPQQQQPKKGESTTQQQHIEVRQGKLMADLAHEFGVEAFVYSSSLPAPLEEMSKEERNPADGDKLVNEGYIKNLGLEERKGSQPEVEAEIGGGEETRRGLNWVIIRPGFFMENLEGFLGSITVTVFREGLTEDATLPLVASKDIGQVVAGVFRDHTRFLHKTLAITSGTVTMREIMAAHQRATGKPIPAIPSTVAKLLIKMNAGTRRVLKLYQLSHDARKNQTAHYPEFETECALARSICHLRTYEEWKRSELQVGEGGGGILTARATSTSTPPAAVTSSASGSGSASLEIERPGTAGTTATGTATTTGSGLGFEAGWNQVSIWKLVTGRS